MTDPPTVRLTVEDTYPSDDDPVPVRIHASHLGRLDVRPGDRVRLTAENDRSIASGCQRNDHIAAEEGLIRMSPAMRRELGVSIGDAVVVSPSSG